MVRVAELSAQSLRAASGTYVFSLRDRFDTLSLAPRITVPTFITHGDQDLVIPVELGRELAAAIRGADYVERPGRGHMNVLDDQTFDAIANFVRGKTP